MNSLLFLSIFSFLGLVYLGIGWLASQKISTVSDYFLAGRKLGLASVTFTLIATQVGGSLLLGAAQWSYEYGIYGIIYALGTGFGFLLLSTSFSARLHSANVSTTAELFETRYNSITLKKLASLISIVSLSGILVAQVIASRSLLTGLGIENSIIFALFWLFVIIYTMIGGLNAVVLTDIFQVLFIIASIGGIFLYCLYTTPFPLFTVKNLNSLQPVFNTNSLTFSKIIATFLMPALFSLIGQDSAQRFFAARSHLVARLSAFLSCIFIALFGFIPVYFGMQAYLTGIEIPTNGSPFIVMLEQITGSNVFFILIACAIIAVITSTADSLLCAVSSNIAQDFNIAQKNSTKGVITSQAITFLVGILAFGISYMVTPNIIDIAVASYEISVSCLLVPLVFSLYKKELKVQAAILSIIFGLIGYLFFCFYAAPGIKEIATLSLSLIGYIIGNNIKKN